MSIRALFLAASVTALVACSPARPEAVKPAEPVVAKADVPVAVTTAPEVVMAFDGAALQAVVMAQGDSTKARYDARHPVETLEFFGIAPGMAVGEALPGGGWYSKILLPYLGDDGRLVGVDYDLALWPNFDFGTPEFIEGKKNWPETWVEDANGWTDGGTNIDAYTFATLPQDGSLDAFLFIRALHNMSRFEDGRFIQSGVAAVYGALKPGGVVGVVQHAGPDDADAEWANGSAGYLRKPDVIAAFEAAGFALVGESDINANPLDMPTTDDIVWRLPPSLATSGENPELRAQMEAIGESNRMTLLFRKP
ncbi:methyltransferase [Algimonas arctica]|uniref:Methyltransferase n=1 Tax=Algimonas arctica TaxID=1479486 RepID=A0A8J3CNS3_9PROT|nr:class I SAM-dependent methyltransferase [Algimonas arctica]GHA88505.1 methyltransferase [Algimonas arctica]